MSSLLAQLIGFIIVIVAMVIGGSILIFINIPSLLIVVGGTLAATLIRFSPQQFVSAIKTSFEALFPPKTISEVPEFIDITKDIIQLTRQKGLLAAENYEVDHPFYKEALSMLIDGYNEEMMQTFLNEQRHLFQERTEMAASIYKSIGDAAPAFGMIGTLVGLVQMLADLSDPNSIGPSMAVAMLTTLYGAMIANLVALPIADKISAWAEQESLRMDLISDAIHYIQSGEHPARAEQLLSVYLTGKKPAEASDNG